MDLLFDFLRKKFGDKYNYLKLYDVVLDKNGSECFVTFLYPMSMAGIDDETRKELEEAVREFLNINAKLSVKFKKSFCDPRLLKKDIKRFIDENFKAISVYLSDEQIDIEEKDDKIVVKFYIGNEIKKFYEANKVSVAVHNFLICNNIGQFDIEAVVDEKYEVKNDVGVVDVVVEAKKRLRYSVTPLKKIVGKDIPPEPEFIKNQDKPKESVILAGYVAGLNQKTFVAKKGKFAGKEKKYYTFTLNDGKSVDCVYFCPKMYEQAIEGLENEMFVLCIGNLEFGLGGKLTYYIRSITYASQKDNLEEIEQEEEKNTVDNHKQVVFGQKYNYTKQSDLFTKSVKYTDYIMQNKFVIYDLETTGLDPQNDEIIEIGAIKIENGEITEYFSTFVHPTKPISAEATSINNITNEMVADAPNITDAIIDFYRFCSGCIVGGYNSDDFDNKFVKNASKKVGFNFESQFIDVFKIARASGIYPKNFKLISVCKFLGIDLVGAHRAYNDAFATACVLLKLNEIQ